jgi:hypothetical protein
MIDQRVNTPAVFMLKAMARAPTVQFPPWKKIFHEDGMQTLVTKGEIDGRYRYLTKAWGWG